MSLCLFVSFKTSPWAMKKSYLLPLAQCAFPFNSASYLGLHMSISHVSYLPWESRTSSLSSTIVNNDVGTSSEEDGFCNNIHTNFARNEYQGSDGDSRQTSRRDIRKPTCLKDYIPWLQIILCFLSSYRIWIWIWISISRISLFPYLSNYHYYHSSQ